MNKIVVLGANSFSGQDFVDLLLDEPGRQVIGVSRSAERSGLFLLPLDDAGQWYRYHALFAEALQYQLEQTHADLLPVLHYRASLWYAEHEQITQAILYALKAHEWQ